MDNCGQVLEKPPFGKPPFRLSRRLGTADTILLTRLSLVHGLRECRRFLLCPLSAAAMPPADDSGACTVWHAREGGRTLEKASG